MEYNEQKDKERHATWLELFYDLIFVVTISQLAFYLHENISFFGFLQFLLLFVPVWWAWVGTTFFATRFYSEDVAHLLLLLMQMGGAAALAVNIHDALGKTSMGFALSYAFMRFLLVVEYYRVLRKHSAESNKIKTNFPHPLIKRYIIGFSIASVIWIISAFVPNFEIRLFLWLVGLIIDFATPITAGRLHSAITAAKKLVGSQGHVLAVDISPQMISIARQRSASLGLQDITEFKESDIESLQLQPLSFDAVLCRWGLMFLPNLDGALKNIFNVLKNEGGRFTAAVWSSPSRTPFIGFPMSIIIRELDIPDQNTSSLSTSFSTTTADNRVLGPFSLADEKILKASLQKAGFKDIQIEKHNVTFEFDSVNDYVNHVQDIAAPLKATLEKESANRQEEIWKMVAKEVKAKFTNSVDDSVIMDNECICFAGTK